MTKPESLGKTALITGGTRGIGRAIVERFMTAGYRVAIGYNTGREQAEAIVATEGVHAFPVHIDVSAVASVDTAVARIEQFFGPVDILVNNAGIAQQKPFLDLTDEDWMHMLSVDLLGAVRCARRVLPKMIARKYGRIINMASIGGQWGGVFQVHYAAAKAGLINFTRSLAKLYSHDGITSNAIAPGLIQTEMITPELNAPAAASRLAEIPVGRIGSVGDVAETALFLASDVAGYITGQTINVNGGVYFG